MDQDSYSGPFGNMVSVIGVISPYTSLNWSWVLTVVRGLALRWDFVIVNNQEVNTHHNS